MKPSGSGDSPTRL